MISWRIAAAWVAALVLTTVLTWQIVGLADSQVGERPAAVAPSIVTSSLVDTTTTTSPTSSTTTVSTTTTPAGDTTSSSTPTNGSSSSISTSGSTSSTSSTAADAEWSVRTINSVGGSVVVRYRPGDVELQAATPAPGFAVEIDDEGPPRVRVEFVSHDLEVRIEVRWETGSLDIDVDEND